MQEQDVKRIDTVAIVGAGLIGLSWAALFAASGRRLHLHDSIKDLRGDHRQARWILSDTPADQGLWWHSSIRRSYGAVT